MATAPAHKTRTPLAHPQRDISHSAKLVWALIAVAIAAFIFIYFAWAASHVY